VRITRRCEGKGIRTIGQHLPRQHANYIRGSEYQDGKNPGSKGNFALLEPDKEAKLLKAVVTKQHILGKNINCGQKYNRSKSAVSAKPSAKVGDGVKV